MASDAPRHNNQQDLDDDDDYENNAVTPHHLNNNNSMMNHHVVRFTNNNSGNPQTDTVVDDDEEDDVDVDDDDVDDDSTSSTDHPVLHHHHPLPPPPVPISAGQVTIALPIPDVTVAASSAAGATTTVVEKKPYPIDESRKLFQRLWTDEDEIELLQGFLDYTTQRGANGSSHHHDTAAFYDQIKNKLQLEFNKNQLVEKLRRLKKKYRNVMQKMDSGKEYVFKSPHDQATFDISRKIWCNGGSAVRNSGSGAGAVAGGGAAPFDEAGFDDDDPSPNPNSNFTTALIDYSPNNGLDDRKIPIRSRKRSRGIIGGGGLNTTLQFNQQQPVSVGIATPAATPTPTTTATATPTPTAIPSVIEETVRSCLSPIFKELLQSVMNLNNNGPRGLAGLAMSQMPLGLGFGVGGGIGGIDLMSDEKWRKQQILELEVFSRRLELVQDQIKAQLDELRGNGS